MYTLGFSTEAAYNEACVAAYARWWEHISRVPAGVSLLEWQQPGAPEPLYPYRGWALYNPVSSSHGYTILTPTGPPMFWPHVYGPGQRATMPGHGDYLAVEGHRRVAYLEVRAGASPPAPAVVTFLSGMMYLGDYPNETLVPRRADPYPVPAGTTWRFGPINSPPNDGVRFTATGSPQVRVVMLVAPEGATFAAVQV
jgi:hypothetical protein